MSEQRLKVESGPPQQMMSDADQVSERAREESGVAGQVKQRAQQAGGPAKEKAREVAGEAKGHVQAAAGQARQQAAAQVDEKSTLVGQQVGSQGEALEGVAGELRKQGQDGPARIAEQAAEKVKDVGDYLERADGEKLLEAAQQVARDNPAAAAAVGAAAGFAAGRVIKASLGSEEASGADEPAAAGEAQPGGGTS
jgi:hypothetical protein